MSEKLTTIGNISASIITAFQIEYAGIYNIISIICLVLTCLSVALSIVSKCVTWYNKANKDGKIDKDEIQDLADQLNEEINGLKDEINRQK